MERSVQINRRWVGCWAISPQPPIASVLSRVFKFLLLASSHSLQAIIHSQIPVDFLTTVAASQWPCYTRTPANSGTTQRCTSVGNFIRFFSLDPGD